MKPDIKPANRDGQPRMTGMARMKKGFPAQNPEPTCRDGARARRVRPKPHHQNAFLIHIPEQNNQPMKTKSLFVLATLIAVLNFTPAGQVAAQTFTTLHNFSGDSPTVLILSGETLYGT